MNALFASDAHVGALNARATAAFIDFLSSVAPQADQLYLLGDIFDAWLGDDDLRAPHDAVIAALATLEAQQTRVFCTHGNHDFLLGEDFARAARVTLLPEVSMLTLGKQNVLLCHGDELCTDDVEYQAFRSYARAPSNQQAFLSLSMPERMQEALKLKAQSKHAVQLKAHDIMDVNVDAVESMLRLHQANWMIHGHTHRPADHTHMVDAAPRRRFVLGDWYEQESLLAWTGSELVRTNAGQAAAVLAA
jgi:UDP-2,3-diacylglucosamine hydrolase